VVVCLERCADYCADLHMAQLMPLPLTVSCFIEIQIGFTFLVPAYPVVPDKGPLNVCVCVCVTLENYSNNDNNSHGNEWPHLTTCNMGWLWLQISLLQCFSVGQKPPNVPLPLRTIHAPTQ